MTGFDGKQVFLTNFGPVFCHTICANISFSSLIVSSLMNVKDMSSADVDSDSEDGRLESLDALRFALTSAPFFRRVHNVQRFQCQPIADSNADHKCAIHVRDVSFAYDDNQQLVLNRINLQVPKGGIYALLGSGSCGKTTLLNCVIGRLRPKSGRIRVFGTNPAISRVPGIGVGFMPQKIALYVELTVAETLHYYGALCQVPMALIFERIQFLLSLFNLPNEDNVIRHLSDNHRWRISLAVALIHSPPLLLLDEPTVNVDPLIRLSIWQHLNGLCREDGLTVVITTHYVEEADGAHTIGLMRNGRLLAEDSPHKLRARFNASSFDQLFQKLCHMDDALSPQDHNHSSDECKSGPPPMAEWPLYDRRLSQTNGSFALNFRRLFASINKILFVMRGNPVLMIFFFVFPSLQMVFFCSSVGRPLKHIPVSVFSADLSGPSSGQVLRSLDSQHVRQEKYSTFDAAVTAVARGEVWAAIVFADHFSDSIHLRYDFVNNLTRQQITESNVKVFADMSNAVIGHQLSLELMAGVQRSLSSIGPKYSSPIAVHCLRSATFMEFLAPGYVVAIMFVAPMALTAYLLIKDQMNGLLDRCLSTGTSALEVLLSHFTTQLMVLVVQEVLVLTTTFALFALPLPRGSLSSLAFIAFLQGVVGISFGLLISAICPNAISAILLTSGTVLPGVFLSGITWPMEAMPRPLRLLSKALPLTLPIESLRCLVSRVGGDGCHVAVVTGAVISGAYSAVNAVAALLVLRLRTNS